MKLEEAHPKELRDRTERATARLARIARVDVYFGGAKALTLAKRMKRSQVPAESVVSAAYTNNEGDAHEFLAYKCPECGEACLGRTKALEHCGETVEDCE